MCDGFEVRRFADRQALRERRDDWAQLDVLIGDGSFEVDETLLSGAPRLRGALSAIIGVEGFDVGSATSRGVLLGNGVVEENWRSMAESTVLMLLASLYELNEAQAVVRENLPRPNWRNARMLRGKCLGFLGFGRIAQEVARLLEPWNVRMLATTRSADRDVPEPPQHVSLDQLIAESDVLVVLATLNSDSAGLIGRDQLERMKPGSRVIVMSRGGIVDEDALAQAVGEGRLAGAALDTFAVEPLPEDSLLRRYPQIVLTPHMVGHTVEMFEAIERQALSEARRLLRGEPPSCLLNPKALSRFFERSAQLAPKESA